MNNYINNFSVKKLGAQKLCVQKVFGPKIFGSRIIVVKKKFGSKRNTNTDTDIHIYEYRINTYTDFPKYNDIPMRVVPMISLSIPRCMIIFPLLYLYLIQQDCLGVMLAKQTPHP